MKRTAVRIKLIKTISLGIVFVFGAVTLLLILLYLTQTSDYQVTSIDSCQSDSKITVFCQFSNPEDIVILPDERHLLISEFGAIVPRSPKHLQRNISLFDTFTARKKSIQISLGDNIWGNTCVNVMTLYFPLMASIIRKDLTAAISLR